MVLYRIDYVNYPIGNCIRWAKTKKEVEHVLKEINKDRCNSSITVSRVWIPKTKEGLCAWLNTYLDTDNG